MKNLAVATTRWLSHLPRRLSGYAQRKLLAARLARVGPGLACDPLTSTFYTPELIEIGSNVFFNMGAYLSGRIVIGDNVMFGPFVTILTGNHMFAVAGRSIRHLRMTLENPEEIKTTTIEDEVWVGANVTVLGGLTVGMGAVIGAGSVVTRDICPYTVAVGNPCKPVRRIFDEERLDQHLRTLGYAPELAAGIVGRRHTMLQGAPVPVVDNTERYPRYFYHGQLVES